MLRPGPNSGPEKWFQTPSKIFMDQNFWKCSLVLNAASKQVKKIGLFGYPSINSVAIIIFGCCVLFAGRNSLDDTYSSTIFGFLYVTVGLFILFLLIFAILFSLNRFRRLKMPKLYLRTPNDSLESKNGYTPLISDV